MAQPYDPGHPAGYRHPDPKISGNMPPGPDQSPYGAQGYSAPSGAAPNYGYSDSNYFPPPPKSERGIYEEAAGYPHGERGYAPTERGSVSDTGGAAQLTPYDEEKAYAQYTDAYGAPYYGQGQQRAPPPPPSDYTAAPPRRSDWEREEDRRRYEDSLRRRHASPPPSTTADYDSEDLYTLPPPTEGTRRRRSSDRKLSRKEAFMQGKGDRGFGATLLGGAAGAFLGEQVGGRKQGDNSWLKTVGGALVGAIGANALERGVEKWEKDRKGKKEEGRYYHESDSYDDLYRGARAPSPVREFRPRREGRRSPRRRESFDSFDSRSSYPRSEYTRRS